jgi:Transposase DDE domain group 1
MVPVAESSTAIEERQTLMDEDIPLPFDLPAVARKKVSAAFDGGRITSDGGVMLLAQAERRLGIADRLARIIPDGRDASRVVHLLPDILRARIFAIACGYEDADDLDRLRFDPAFKLACGRLPDTGRDLCSQPTVSRWENAPNLREIIRLMDVMVDFYCASYPAPPTATSRPVVVLLRPGKTPSGIEVRGHLRRLVRRIRKHWPSTRITIRGDGHYGRPEVMEWCDENGVDFVFGLPGNAVLDRLVEETADDIRTRRALDQKPCLRGFAETSYKAKSWNTDRRACARIEATTKGLDIRFVVTSIETRSAEHIYETLYCARGQAENLIKLHKAQLASDRTSCRSPLANQMRLILHTAAYWLMLTVRDAIPKAHALATASSPPSACGS